MLKQPFLSRLLAFTAKMPAASKHTVSTDRPETEGKPEADSSAANVATLVKEDDSSAIDTASTAAVPNAAKPETTKLQKGTASNTTSKRKRPSRKAISSAAAILAVAAGSGYVAIRGVPSQLQAAVGARRASTPPLSKPGDPIAEPMVSTSDLFLIHQIFYRKLEALTGIPVSILSTPSAPATLPTPGTPARQASAESTTAKPRSAIAPNNSSGGDSSATTPATPSQSQPERVVADAPPAPQAAPVSFEGTTIDSVLEMRVAVAKDVSAIGFATSDSGVITDLDGNILKSLTPETAAMAEISDGLVVDGEAMPSAFWVYPEDGGYVAVGSSWYRGRVLIALRERGLIAVNYVLLGDYLYSVVGSEMSPGWAIESLKAQAVAARSYALTHNIRPASEAYFDLDNTQRFQAYKGIGREADTTQAAVQATAGEFISHEGGIVESLYAASQAIVDDAHSGAGMSQLGAKDLAEQGYSYQEILAHYYPGTALGRIETDPE
ncbi:MAG: SpoIID/LytB domain-containing protein [Cyanobacteria bacterium J06643_4]